MSNVLALSAARPRAVRSPGAERLVDLSAHHRYDPQDVRWLKENAEALRLLVTCRRPVSAEVLDQAHGDTCRTLADRLAFFPQYYRFFLSIALDLAELGMPVPAEALVAQAMDEGLHLSELSDLQRAEARLFAQRVGVDGGHDPALDDRLMRFAARTATFALPNKKAAYELTHIAFYLSDYGRKRFDGAEMLHDSLMHAGCIAWLEQNIDLLSEISVALRFCGAVPPQYWDDAIAMGLGGCAVSVVPRLIGHDDFHCWMMACWARSEAGDEPLERSLPAGTLRFDAPGQGAALQDLSLALLRLGSGRNPDWASMRNRLQGEITRSTLALLDTAARETPVFETFFARFARATQSGHAA